MLWGVLEVDLFMTTENTKATKFCSRAGKDMCSWEAAFQILWEGGTFLCIPSISATYKDGRKSQERKIKYDLCPPLFGLVRSGLQPLWMFLRDSASLLPIQPDLIGINPSQPKAPQPGGLETFYRWLMMSFCPQGQNTWKSYVYISGSSSLFGAVREGFLWVLLCCKLYFNIYCTWGIRIWLFCH